MCAYLPACMQLLYAHYAYFCIFMCGVSFYAFVIRKSAATSPPLLPPATTTTHCHAYGLHTPEQVSRCTVHMPWRYIKAHTQTHSHPYISACMCVCLCTNVLYTHLSPEFLIPVISLPNLTLTLKGFDNMLFIHLVPPLWTDHSTHSHAHTHTPAQRRPVGHIFLKWLWRWWRQNCNWIQQHQQCTSNNNNNNSSLWLKRSTQHAGGLEGEGIDFNKHYSCCFA